MKKFLKYLLTYILGFITCIALIVGAVFWAFNSITINTIENWTGTTIIDESQIDEDAEVDVKGLSLSRLFGEITKISSESNTMTIDKLITRYGLQLDDEVLALFPERAMGIPLNKLFSEEGTNEILQNTNFEYIYSIIGEEAIPEPLKSVLSEKSLDKVVAGDLNYIMEGVKLGYIAGVTYEKSGDEWKVVYKNPDEPTMVELLEGVAVDDLLATFNEGGDILQVLVDGAGDIPLNLLIESITAGDTLLGVDVTIDDFYKFDEELNAYSINLEALVGSMKIGHVMGYTPVEEDGEIIGWKTAEDVAVTAINETFANVALADVVSGNFDVIDALGGFYIGELIGYTPIYEAGEIVDWLNGEDEVDEIISKFASTKIEELIEGNFDVVDMIGGFYIGELIGYTPIYEAGEIVNWLNGEEEVDEIISKFASAKVEELIDGTFDVSDEIMAMKIADILGYTSAVYPVYNGGVQMQVGGVDVNHTVWLDGEEEANFVMSALAGKTIGELTDGISEYTIGALAGYVEIDGTWYSLEKSMLAGDTVYVASTVEGIIKHFVALSVESLSTGGALEDTINDIVIGEALGYVQVKDIWYIEYVSEAENVPVDGVLKSLVGLKISDLKNSNTITDVFQGVVVGELMGYYCEDGVWYTNEEKTEKVTGILASIVGLSVEELSDEEEIRNILNAQSVGDMLGYYYDGEKWCDNETSKTPLTGISKTIAGLTVGNLGDAESIIKDMQIGELMGYTLDGDGNYKDGEKTLSAIMQTISKTKVSNLQTSIEGLTVEDVFGDVTGVLSWIPSDTLITDISTVLPDAVAKAELGDCMDAGILAIEGETKDKLNFYLPDWSKMTVSGLLEGLIAILPAPPGL